jgi:hypothetical protein
MNASCVICFSRTATAHLSLAAGFLCSPALLVYGEDVLLLLLAVTD